MQDESGSVNIVVVSILIGVVLLIGAILLFSGKEIVTLPLKFEEFTDLQCPACKTYHPVVKTLVAEFSDNIDYSFKSFPLKELHPESYNRHLAVQAAGLQGKLTNAADLFFEKQETMTDNEITTMLSQIEGIDMDKFQTDWKSQAVKDSVDADINDGLARGISATPTFYINGEKVVFKEGDNPEEILRNLIKQKIELGLSQKK
jgi:predicted DsbA family dithiol-disulfide isomerase